MNNALTKITAHAKKLQKQHKNLTWKDAVKKASADYRKGKKVGAIKMIEKKETKKTPVKKVYRVERKKNGTIKTMTSVNGISNNALNSIKDAKFRIEKAEMLISINNDLRKKSKVPDIKKAYTFHNKKLRQYISNEKKYINSLKKHI